MTLVDRIRPSDADLAGARRQARRRDDKAGLRPFMKYVSVQRLHDDLPDLGLLPLTLHQDGRWPRWVFVPRPDPSVDVAIIATGSDLDPESIAFEDLVSQSLELAPVDPVNLPKLKTTRCSSTSRRRSIGRRSSMT